MRHSQRHLFTLGFSGAVFLASSLASIFLLAYVIPVFFAAHSNGVGLLGPVGDWLSYHDQAKDMALELHQKGFGQWWELFLLNKFIAINAVFYYFFGPYPLVLVPLYSALNAVAAGAMYSVASRLVRNPWLAMLAVAPFFMLPTSLFLASHPLKDIYFLAGFFLFLSAQFDLPETIRGKGWATFLGKQLASILLLYVSRPYMLHLVGLALIFPAAPIGIGCLKVLLERDFPSVARATGMISVLTFSFVLCNFLSNEVATAVIPPPSESIIHKQTFAVRATTTESTTPAPVIEKEPPDWKNSPVLPDAIDRRFHAIAVVRDGFVRTAPLAPTAKDSSLKFYSAREVLEYLPRASQIGFLAPFPSDWAGVGSAPLGRWMRNCTGLEMIFFYFCLLGIVAAAVLFFDRYEFWSSVLICALLVEAYALMVNNIGTLYRLRFGMVVFLAMMGLCGILRALELVRARSA